MVWFYLDIIHSLMYVFFCVLSMDGLFMVFIEFLHIFNSFIPNNVVLSYFLMF